MKIRGFVLALLLVCCVAMMVVGYCYDQQGRPNTAPVVSDRKPYVEVSMSDREVSLVSAAVEEWTKWENNAVELYEQYRIHDDTYGVKTVAISWGIFDIPDGSFIRKQHFEVATDEGFQNAQRYDLRAGERSIELRDLLVDTQYFFRINVELEGNEACTLTDSFQTKWSPRIIELENVRNSRDIGGWKTVDGKSVKQCMLYRGSELDGATDTNLKLTADGAEIMGSQLKIKTELDLRSANQDGVRDVLGPEVKHQYVDFPSCSDFLSGKGVEKTKEVFEVLAEEENYPVYLHCSYGVDRTGIVCYVLEALLGMSAEDCCREWELSALDLGDCNDEDMTRFVAAFQELEGETLQNKAENYLLSAGITQAQIDSIRAIFTQ